MSKLKATENEIPECSFIGFLEAKGQSNSGLQCTHRCQESLPNTFLPKDESLSDSDDPKRIQLPGPPLGVRCPGQEELVQPTLLRPTSNATSWPTIQGRLVTYSIQFCVDPNKTPPVPCSCVTLNFNQFVYLFWDFDPVYL